MEEAAASPQISRMTNLNISMKDGEIVLSTSYLGDTELRMQTELAAIAKDVLDRQVPCRKNRVLKMTIDRNEENLELIEKAIAGNNLLHVTFTQVSMKLIPDVARCLRGVKSKAVTIYQEKFDDAQQSSAFSDVVSALKSPDTELDVELAFREYSDHSAAFLSLFAVRVDKLNVEIQTWDKSEDKFINTLTPLLPQLVSQSTPNELLFFRNQFAPFKTTSIDYEALCRKLEASKSKRRLILHVDEKPDEVRTSGSVSFKVVPFNETFVVHIDSTGSDCDCYACEFNEREEAETRERNE